MVPRGRRSPTFAVGWLCILQLRMIGISGWMVLIQPLPLSGCDAGHAFPAILPD
jgi:hypothetical protein